MQLRGSGRTPVAGPPAALGRPSRHRRGLPRRRRLSGQTTSRVNQRRVLRLPAVGLLELSVGRDELFGLEHGEGALSEELRPAHPTPTREVVEARDEFVVELNQDLTACHEHMVEHMGGAHYTLRQRHQARLAVIAVAL